MSWSGGSISFSPGSGTAYTYSVTYNAPTYTYPSGATSITNSTSGGPGTVNCGFSNSVSKTYTTSYYWPAIGETVTESTTISATAPACPVSYPPSWSDNTLGPFVATVAYSDGVSATNMNYSGSYSVSSGSLPTGISFNTSTGAVTGTPTIPGQAYSFTLAASNSYNTITQAFSGNVGVVPSAGKAYIWNGTAWTYGPAKIWDGTTWVAGTVKIWNGTSWVTSI